MIEQLGKHSGSWDFEVRNDALVIEDRTLAEIAVAVGSTPFYVYSSRAIRRRVAELRRILPPKVRGPWPFHGAGR